MTHLYHARRSRSTTAALTVRRAPARTDTCDLTISASTSTGQALEEYCRDLDRHALPYLGPLKLTEASPAPVSIERNNGQLVVRVRSQANGVDPERAARLDAIGDRVGALGGSVEIGPTTVRAEIPCA
jgi:hypothetical protein